jgi:retron-type reverse transcriptase
MYLLAKRISDKRILKLIRDYLESGVMLGGLASPTREGTPQGGPLSPLLSRKGYWRIADSHILNGTLTLSYFRNLCLVGLSDIYIKSESLRTAVCRSARTVV